jgi:hypothetical protein
MHQSVLLYHDAETALPHAQSNYRQTAREQKCAFYGSSKLLTHSVSKNIN